MGQADRTVWPLFTRGYALAGKVYRVLFGALRG